MRVTSYEQSVALERIVRGITKPCPIPSGTSEYDAYAHHGLCTTCGGSGIIHPYRTLSDWLRAYNGSEWPSLVWADYSGNEWLRTWWSFDQVEIAQHYGYAGPTEYIHDLTLDEAFELLAEVGWRFVWDSYSVRTRCWMAWPPGIEYDNVEPLFVSDTQAELLDKVLAAQVDVRQA